MLQRLAPKLPIFLLRVRPCVRCIHYDIYHIKRMFADYITIGPHATPRLGRHGPIRIVHRSDVSIPQAVERPQLRLCYTRTRSPCIESIGNHSNNHNRNNHSSNTIYCVLDHFYHANLAESYKLDLLPHLEVIVGCPALTRP